MCNVLLFEDCLDNTIHRWLEESGNIGPRISELGYIRIQSIGMDRPHQFQLTKTNIVARVVVSSRSKFDILRFLSFHKPKFGRLIKTRDDVV